MKTVKAEWWFDDASFAASKHRDVFLARKLVFEDGTAEVLLQSGERLELSDEDEADVWLGDEEYRRIDALYDHFGDEGVTIPSLDLPGKDEEGPALLERMHIVLPVGSR
jgi:hypothetical protein